MLLAADLLEAATSLVATIRRTRPQVVVTYDDFGQYGHPDHIQAHRVTSYALVLAAAPSFRPDLGEPWDVAKLYWTALPKSAVKKGIDAFVAAGGQGFFGLEEGEDLPWALDDALVTTAITALDQEPHKMAALRAHLTQVGTENDFFRAVRARRTGGHGGRVLPARPRAGSARRGPTGSRTTSSPG